jgi:hypothetical protein
MDPVQDLGDAYTGRVANAGAVHVGDIRIDAEYCTGTLE